MDVTKPAQREVYLKQSKLSLYFFTSSKRGARTGSKAKANPSSTALPPKKRRRVPEAGPGSSDLPPKKRRRVPKASPGSASVAPRRPKKKKKKKKKRRAGGFAVPSKRGTRGVVPQHAPLVAREPVCMVVEGTAPTRVVLTVREKPPCSRVLQSAVWDSHRTPAHEREVAEQLKRAGAVDDAATNAEAEAAGGLLPLVGIVALSGA